MKSFTTYLTERSSDTTVDYKDKRIKKLTDENADYNSSVIFDILRGKGRYSKVFQSGEEPDIEVTEVNIKASRGIIEVVFDAEDPDYESDVVEQEVEMYLDFLFSKDKKNI